MLAFRVSRQWVRLLEADGAEVLLSLIFQNWFNQTSSVSIGGARVKGTFLNY